MAIDIKTVRNLPEFKHLMKAIEKKLPNVRWCEGQKPTGWHPSGFPRTIFLNDNELFCE